MIFDRTVSHDLRSFNYVLTGTETLPIVTRTWSPQLPILNQFDLGACTGFAAAGVTAAMPGLTATNRRRLCRNQQALSYYVLATNFDEFDGTWNGQPGSEDTGSTVTAALKAARNLGWVGLFQFLTSARAVAGAVSHIGPVQMGTTWFNSMMDTQPVNGEARVVVDTHSGGDDQGHSWAIIGVNAERGTVIGKQSWGDNWGAAGLFEMSLADLDKLIALDGDAVVVSVNKTLDPDAGLV